MATTKKEWLRNFCNTESWYSKDLQGALAEWDELEAENIVLKEMLNQYRTDFKIQNEGIRDLQLKVSALKAEIDLYEDERIKFDEVVKAHRIEHGVNSNPPPPKGLQRPDPPPSPPRERN